MQLENNLLIKCRECNNSMKIHSEELECETSSYERNMGPEVSYDFYGYYECSNCGNEINFNIIGYEYPIGSFNYEDNKISGGIFLQPPSLSIVYDYDFDDEVIDFIMPTIVDRIIQIQNNPEFIFELTPREFEEVVAEIFESDGFEVTLTKQTRDGGRDIIVKQVIKGSPFIMIIECKQFKKSNKVSVDVVRSLCGVQTADNVNKAMIVTSSFFSNDAIAFAEKRGALIGLADFTELMNWINNYKF